MKFGEVEVTFGGVVETQHVPVVPHGTPHLVPQTELGAGDVSMELSAQQQKLLEELQIVDMSIEDPIAYENYNVDQLVNGDRSLDA